jgi:lysophospholipase L1-like esterase
LNIKKGNTRQRIFKTIAVLLPFFVLILVEIILRVCNYGYNTHLFIEDATGKYYHLNPEISQKYFTIRENATQGNYELFPKEKKAGTIRLFVLGESSSVGFPYMHNGAFSRMLKYRLQFACPDTNFEIINLSLTAVNSYTLYDFSKQLVNYQPDAVLIYAGHNEYYGALGVASTSRVGRNPLLIRAAIALKELKLGQLVFRLAAGLKGTDKKTTDYSLTLMERMAHEQSIPFNSTLYQQGIDQFNANMTGILNIFNKHHVPVFISNQVYNLKDLKPFINSNSILSANKQYESGNKAYAQGDYKAAKSHYILAKEYDELRFRAPEKINILIESYARNIGNVHFVDALHEFEDHSPHGIMDSTLLLEHVHPNLRGQQLISDAFYKELKKSGIIPEMKDTIHSLFIKQDDYPFTDFDRHYGQISIWLLKEQWPFNEPIPAEDPNHVRTFEEEQAGACAVKQQNWFEAMHSLYEFYKQKKELGKAMQIMEGLCLEFPYDEEYFLLAGKLGFMQNEQKKALFYVNKSIDIAPSSEAISLRKMIMNHQMPTGVNNFQQ